MKFEVNGNEIELDDGEGAYDRIARAALDYPYPKICVEGSCPRAPLWIRKVFDFVATQNEADGSPWRLNLSFEVSNGEFELKVWS